MLKIKGNLEKLKSIRFYKRGNDYLFGDEQDACLYVESDGCLGIYFCSSSLDGDIPDFLLDKLYILIKANIVEKVGE